MGLKTVFFDLDGTLVHLPPDFNPARFLFSVSRKLGLAIELEKVERVYEEVEDGWTEHFQDYTLWATENLGEFNRCVLLKLGYGAEGVALQAEAHRVQDHWDRLPDEAGGMLYPDAVPALRRFKAHGLVLGIVSYRTLAAIRCSVKKTWPRCLL